MSIELSVALQELKKDVLALQAQIAAGLPKVDPEVAAFHDRLKAIEQWIADRKPGPKPK